jgi:hypothetical protein
MDHDCKTIGDVAATMRQVWREAARFLLSIELWLMVLVAFATVGGFWLAVMGSALCLPAFGFAGAYVGARVTLHVKRIVAWPFIG